MEGADGGEIAGGGGVVEGGVEGGEEIGSGVDAAVSAEEDGFGGELFVADEDRPVGALGGELEEPVDLDHVCGTVFDADDARVLEGAFGGGEGDGDLGEGGQVVEEERERDGGGARRGSMGR